MSFSRSVADSSAIAQTTDLCVLTLTPYCVETVRIKKTVRIADSLFVSPEVNCPRQATESSEDEHSKQVARPLVVYWGARTVHVRMRANGAGGHANSHCAVPRFRAASCSQDRGQASLDLSSSSSPTNSSCFAASSSSAEVRACLASRREAPEPPRLA